MQRSGSISPECDQHALPSYHTSSGPLAIEFSFERAQVLPCYVSKNLEFYDCHRRKDVIVPSQFVRLKIKVKIVVEGTSFSDNPRRAIILKATDAFNLPLVTLRVSQLSEEGTYVKSDEHKCSKLPNVKKDKLLEGTGIF